MGLSDYPIVEFHLITSPLRSAFIILNILSWCWIVSMWRRVCRNDSVILLCTEHATVSLKPAKSPGNDAAAPGFSDWTVRAKADARGGALLQLCRESGETCTAFGSRLKLFVFTIFPPCSILHQSQLSSRSCPTRCRSTRLNLKSMLISLV